MEDPVQNLEDEILDLVASSCKLDRALLVREAQFTNLGLASLDIVEMVFALEEKYDISIPFNANATARGDAAGGIADVDFTTVGGMLAEALRLIEESRAKAELAESRKLSATAS
jgi:acyl carrier protein